MKTPIKIFLGSFLIFFFSWLGVYKAGINDLYIQSEDTLPALFIPVTIVKEGTLYVDTYYDMLLSHYPHPDDKSFEKGLTPFYLQKVSTESGDHYVSAFPIIPGLVAVPVFLIPLLLNVEITFELLAVLGHLAASLSMALCGALFYVLLYKYLRVSQKQSFLLTCVYLFATLNFSLLSQALWQHGVLQLFVILSLISLYRSFSAEKNILLLFLSGLFLGIGVLTRPTVGLLLPYFGLIIAFFSVREDFSLKISALKASIGYFTRVLTKYFAFFSGLVPVYLFFSWYTQKYYLGIQNNGYSDQLGVGWLSRFPEGFVGIWASPSKGLLVYSPVFVFSLIGLFMVIINEEWRKRFDYLIFGAIVIVHTLVLSRWKHWYGGWSFGYRMASDVIPFLVLLIVPFVTSTYFQKYKKTFTVLFVISILVQVSGIVFFDGVWHAAYDNGFENTTWLWSLRDSELMFNIRRILVKMHLLDKACPECMPIS